MSEPLLVTLEEVLENLDFLLIFSVATRSKLNYGNSSVIRQNGKSENGCYKKVHLIFRKTNISYPLISIRTSADERVRNNRFSENLVCFVFV